MMNVLFAGNDVVYTGLELAIYSLLTHNKHVNIFIFTMSVEVPNHETGEITVYEALTDWQQSKLKKIVKYLDCDSNIAIIDTKDYYYKYLANGVNDTSGFTPYAGLRLIVDKVLPELDRVLYLDADTAIQKNLNELYYDIPRNNPDYNYYASFAKDACDYEGEMVSGVIVFNLEKIKESHFLDRAVENFKKNKYIYPDQMALRDAGTAYPLPETYGYMEPLEKCFYSPAIIHFTNKLSPKIYDCNPDYGRTYFYKRFPQFKYVKEGCELLDTLDIEI